MRERRGTADVRGSTREPRRGVEPLTPVGLARYRLALQAGHMGTWYWDITTGRLDWDEQLEHVFGLEPGSFGGTFDDYVALLHPDDVEATQATVRRSLETGEDHYVEHRVVAPDGSVRWVSGTGRVLTGPRGEAVGMVGVGADITEQRALHDAQLAAEAASAIAREDAALSQGRLALLGRVSGALGASLDVGTTLQQVADLVVREQVADWCVLDLPDGSGGLGEAVIAHRDPAMVELARRLRADYPPELRGDRGLGKVLRTGEPELWPTIPPELIAEGARDETHHELLLSLGLSAAMLVPLPARGRIRGAMTLLRTHGRGYDERDLEVAVELGRRAGVALDNAHLYADRDRVARTLQQSLLPPTLPVVPGLDISARYRPGSPALGIGGDFYDVFPVGEHSWRIVVGDVCGKGVEAAALTAAVRYALRTAAVLTATPVAALHIVNETLQQQDWHGRFASLVLLHVDLHATGPHIALAAAGHPPPLLRRAGGTVEVLESPGTIVGALPDVQFFQTSRDLAPGDCLLLYTDGATEAGQPGELFGQQGLVDALTDAPSGPCSAITAAVLDAVDTFAQSARTDRPRGQDDLALLAVLVA